MKRWQVIFIICLCYVVSVGVLAQSTPRDYALSTPQVTYSDDNTSFTVEFTVSNQGGDATEPAEINIIQDGVGRIEATDTLPPLDADEVVTVEFEFQMANFEAGEKFFAVEVGIDQFELAGSPIARDNRALFRVTVPVNVPSTTGQPSSNQDTPPVTSADAFDFVIPLVDVGVKILPDGVQINQDVFTTQQILIGVGVIAVVLVLLWFFTLILRLLFRRPQTFGTWQPPYAMNVYHDPNSTLGRRQGWQTHAQNGTIFDPCSQNHVVALKRLMDNEGNILGEWQIKALRSIQYDMYGRISRTEVIMPSNVVKKLNKIAHRASKYDYAKLRKTLTPIAKTIAKRAGKPITKKSAMLPIALDLRFEGKHGEVRIKFELYQCRNGLWHLIDQWEPEMGVIGHKIIENYTYTLNGQLPGESYKEYKKRLVEDMTWVLGSMLTHQQQSQEETDPDLVPPDTLTGMAPITDSMERPADNK